MYLSAVAPPDVWSQLGPYVAKALIGLAISGALGVIVWPFRKLKAEWVEMKKDQASIHSELVQQRTNCLTTLQLQGEEQVKLLSKAVDILDGVRLDLAEQTGYLKAFVPAPRTRKAAAKK